MSPQAFLKASNKNRSAVVAQTSGDNSDELFDKENLRLTFCKAVAKLIEKQAIKQAAAVAKSEQKMLDEFASNQFYQRQLKNPTL